MVSFPRRTILTFVDETAIPYGDDYENAVSVMTAFTTVRLISGQKRSEWETWAELPNGEQYIRLHQDGVMAENSHEACVQDVIAKMDAIFNPHPVTKKGGVFRVMDVGGFIAQKDGVTYVRKATSGKWEELKPPERGLSSCGQCRGSGVYHNDFGMEVRCDCTLGGEIESEDCEDCEHWKNPNCPRCHGKGEIHTRKKNSRGT